MYLHYNPIPSSQTDTQGNHTSWSEFHVPKTTYRPQNNYG